jgi:hypothetical protein
MLRPGFKTFGAPLARDFLLSLVSLPGTAKKRLGGDPLASVIAGIGKDRHKAEDR